LRDVGGAVRKPRQNKMVFVVTVASCYSKFKVSTNRTSLPAVLLTLNICFFSWSTCHV